MRIIGQFPKIANSELKAEANMTQQPFETGPFLEWLEEVLTAAEAVDVDVIVFGQPDSRSSVQITLRGVPGALGGLEVRRAPTI